MDEFISGIIQNESWFAFPLCYLAGLVSSTSPCWFQIIPVVIGYVGGYAEGSQKKAIQCSLIFTLGLTITFMILGIIASLFGRLFGAVGDFWKYIIPAVSILLGLQLVTGFTFNTGFAGKFMPQKKALLGALLAGLLFGLLAAPTATPVLGVILTYAATKQSYVYGGGLLLAYAAGHWVLVLLAGISAGLAQKILASRGVSYFTAYIKKGAGVILIGTGIYLFITLITW